MLPLLLLAACESMESTGSIFTPAAEEAPLAVVDPVFAVEPEIRITSEEMQGAAPDGGPTLADAAGVDAGALVEEPEPEEIPVAAPAAPPAVGLPAPVQWPVRLVSTVPQAQPPRAILGLPSGEERVVSPGSILAEQGLVVMTVTADRVQLAQIEPAGDHATIRSLELTAQYGTAPTTR